VTQPLKFFGVALEAQESGDSPPLQYSAKIGVFEVRVYYLHGGWSAMLRTVRFQWGVEQIFAEPDDNYLMIVQRGENPAVALDLLYRTTRGMLEELEKLRLGLPEPGVSSPP
jgi:hypothetical protein